LYLSSKGRHTRSKRDWTSDVYSSDLNHTYSHVHMDQLTPEQNREEVVHNENVLAAAGAPITFKGIRPPFGGSDPNVQRLLIEMGYTYFLNRIDGADWLPDKSAAAIRDDIVAQL